MYVCVLLLLLLNSHIIFRIVYILLVLSAELSKEDRKRTEVTVCKCNQPSPRSNMTLCPHPERPELFMFGGEFCAGNKTYLYNDLYLYVHLSLTFPFNTI